jgi:enoyl-CoA hydratase/carnithine racemase
MSSDSLLLECDGPVATVTFNRPHVRNALNAETLATLRQRMIASAW